MAGERPICDRDTLYEEVWKEPMQVVAKRYGVSDVALAKTCRKLGVPVPGRGYWAKLKAGRADPRPALPPPEVGQRKAVTLHPVEHPMPPEWATAVEAAPLTQPIIVHETLEDPHKLVVLSGRYLAKAHPTNGLVSVTRRTCLAIQVSPESLDRALRIFDALIKALKAADLQVEVAVVEEPVSVHRYDCRPLDREPHRPARVTRVLCEGESIEFSLNESVRRVEVPRSQHPGKGEHIWEPKLYKYVPTGELALQLTNTAELGVRSRWQDGKRQRLEDLLDDFVGNLSRVALAFKLRRQAEEERAAAAREAERRRLEESLRRREEEERRQEEERRGKELEHEVTRWRRAEDIRSYVQAALDTLGDAEPANEADRLARERLLWALEYADRIDPLRGSSE